MMKVGHVPDVPGRGGFMASIAFTNNELQALIGHRPQAGAKVLTVYLDVDQSRQSNVNHGYLRTAKDRLRAREQSIKDPHERESFNRNCEKILETISTEGARGRTLVLISDASNDFLWRRELFINLAPAVRWDERPYVRPLVEAVDEYERYCVVVADREKGRIFSVYLGQIEEEKDVMSAEKRKYIKAAGKDTVRSQPGWQRREEEHALWHLKEVAGAVENLASRVSFDRLILAGQHEITNELRGILPKRLQALVVREIPLAVDESDHAVLKATMRVEEEVERESEVRLVDQLITAAAKDSQGVMGLQPTLNAMRQGRIMRLVYVFGHTVTGSLCPKCESLFEGNPGACPYDSARPLKPVDDVVERLADLVVDSGGRSENVRGPAAEKLEKAGRIGALLRF